MNSYVRFLISADDKYIEHMVMQKPNQFLNFTKNNTIQFQNLNFENFECNLKFSFFFIKRKYMAAWDKISY